MDPLLIGGGIALGLFIYNQNKKKGSARTGGGGGGTDGHAGGGAHGGGRATPGGGGSGDGGDGRGAVPTGPFDPFNVPDVTPPEQGGDEVEPGDGGGNGGGGAERPTDPAPLPVPPGTTLSDIGPYTLAITFDCQDVLEGAQWWSEVFYPACIRLVELDGDAFNHPYILMRALLLSATDATCPPDAPECNLEPGCILNWTYFLGPILDVPGGEWDSNTNEGYGAFLAYSDWYATNYPAVDAFLQAVESRLWSSDLAAHFNQYVDESIVFVPPGEVA